MGCRAALERGLDSLEDELMSLRTKLPARSVRGSRNRGRKAVIPASNADEIVKCSNDELHAIESGERQ